MFETYLNLAVNFMHRMGIINALEFFRATIDVSIVAFVIYKSIILLRDTRAYQLVKGIVILLVITQISEYLKLETITFLLRRLTEYGVFALIIVFQPELRKALEHIGRGKLGLKGIFDIDQNEYEQRTNNLITEITKACEQLSKSYTGGLIVLERESKLGEVIRTGVSIDSEVNSHLLINIFCPNTPLHDGAVIIRGDRIVAASCFLPLTDNSELDNELGTRHRAALGISENSDSIAVVVSEETSKISLAINGQLTRNLNSETLKKALNKLLNQKGPSSKRIFLWKGKQDEKVS